jgi:hypothetical protein
MSNGDGGMKFTPGGAGIPGGQQQQQQQPLNVDASTLETFICTECKGHLFQNLVVVKRISPINPVNTTGKEMFAPMQVLSCTNCGHIPDEFGGKAVPQEEDTGSK